MSNRHVCMVQPVAIPPGVGTRNSYHVPFVLIEVAFAAPKPHTPAIAASTATHRDFLVIEPPAQKEENRRKTAPRFLFDVASGEITERFSPAPSAVRCECCRR